METTQLEALIGTLAVLGLLAVVALPALVGAVLDRRVDRQIREAEERRASRRLARTA